ncbi:alpha/beta hydrolase [Aquincola sp. S2]|uniref:Alpha/beta hydrolase n=1 Tax=Pseudaquabacterium terrae TaxID=2732868 RepID=A0ABX2EUN5_9BURK|nr:alpha/beta hydrolase [Aquabacterium terrae]NRF72357.1 alpha/beta hydrolase [Aquabacterium terrae]
MTVDARAPRLLIVPGLHDSGPAHWQSWLQSHYRHSLRVVQRDWQAPDLERWSARIGATLERAGPGPWIAAAHSFGCLALVHHLARTPDSPLRSLLLVAPAEPDRFGLAEALPQTALPRPGLLIGSQNDPWMSAGSARRWAERWGCQWINLGDAGHINAEAGFGPLPLARRWVLSMAQRLAREQRPARAGAEWSFAV